MKFPFEFVYCCGSPLKEGERIWAAAAGPCVEGEEWERPRWAGRRRGLAGAAVEWKLLLCAISKDVVAVTVERVGGGGGGETKKKAAVADPALEQERSASRKRSGGLYARVHNRGFNSDEYDQSGQRRSGSCLCVISKDVVAMTVERVGEGGGGETKKKAATADPALEQEWSASRKRSGGSYVRVHDRGFNDDKYD